MTFFGTPKGVPIGVQAVAEQVSVAPIILGAGHGEPIELLGIDPIDAKPRSKKASTTGP